MLSGSPYSHLFLGETLPRLATTVTTLSELSSTKLRMCLYPTISQRSCTWFWIELIMLIVTLPVILYVYMMSLGRFILVENSLPVQNQLPSSSTQETRNIAF